MEQTPIYKITAFTEKGETLELFATKKVQGINDYLLSDKKYRALQFSCFDRPSHYEQSTLHNRRFNGYLIGRGKHALANTIPATFKFEKP